MFDIKYLVKFNIVELKYIFQKFFQKYVIKPFIYTPTF